MDQRHVEMQIFLKGDFFNHFAHKRQLWFAAAAARRPDQHGNFLVDRGYKHQRQVALQRLPRHKRNAFTQIMWTRVHRAAIGSDEV